MARIAGRRHGIVTHAELVAAGLGRGAIAHRLKQKRLHRVHRGVYVVGHRALPPLALETAAVLSCGENAALSHVSAAALRGLLPGNPRPIDVVVSGRNPGERRGVRVHRTTRLDAGEVCRYREIRVTSPARTLLDLAEAVPLRQLERAYDEANRRRLTDRGQLVALLAHAHGRRGTAALRTILDRDAEPAFTRSEAEERFLALVRKAELPEPIVNSRLHGYEVDFHWPALRLVVEVDGYAFHSSRAAFERDRLKRAKLQAHGVAVIPVTWRQMADAPEPLIARLGSAMARGENAA